MEVELIGETPRRFKTKTEQRCTVIVLVTFLILIVIAVCVVISVLYTSKKAEKSDHHKTTVSPPNDTVCLSSACLRESAGE